MYSNGEEYGLDDASLGEYEADGSLKTKGKKEKSGSSWFGSGGGKSKKKSTDSTGLDDDLDVSYDGFTGSFGVDNQAKKKSSWFGGGGSKKKASKTSASSADPLDSLFSGDDASSNNFGFDDPVQETSEVKAFFNEVRNAHRIRVSVNNSLSPRQQLARITLGPLVFLTSRRKKPPRPGLVARSPTRRKRRTAAGLGVARKRARQLKKRSIHSINSLLTARAAVLASALMAGEGSGWTTTMIWACLRLHQRLRQCRQRRIGRI
jgi:hypothetical protein